MALLEIKVKILIDKYFWRNASKIVKLDPRKFIDTFSAD